MRIILLSYVLPLCLWVKCIHAEGYRYSKIPNLFNNFVPAVTPSTNNAHNFGALHGGQTNIIPATLQHHIQQTAIVPNFAKSHALTYPTATQTLTRYTTSNILPFNTLSADNQNQKSVNSARNNANQLSNTIKGNYISQSEASQLDQYTYKQRQAGDSRPYKRVVTTCYENGQCENREMSLDDVDQQHQQVINALRAQIHFMSKTCSSANQQNNQRNLDYFLPKQQQQNQQAQQYQQQQFSANFQPTQTHQHSSHGHEHFGNAKQFNTNAQVRPLERRLYPYNEIVGPGIYN